VRREEPTRSPQPKGHALSILFRTKTFLTLGELVPAWAAELEREGAARARVEEILKRTLLEDIVNGKLDHSGPEVEGGRLGLRFINDECKPGFIEGRKLEQLAISDHPMARFFVSSRLVLLKEAIIDFARRRRLPQPSWWAEESQATSDQNQTKERGRAIRSKPDTDQPMRTLTHLTARVRGRKPAKLERVKKAMRTDLREGRCNPATLGQMLEKELEQKYGASRDTVRKARNAVLSEIVENPIRDK
jgi:Bacterial regulatory proteins, gntR family